MSATPPPTAKEVRDLYEMLLGRTIEVSPDYEVLKPGEEFGCCVAFFNDAVGVICAVYTVDLDLCAYAEAVLQLIPAAGAQDCISNGCLDDNYIENVYEVLNAFSSLFNKEGVLHVSIGLIYTPDEELPANEYRTVTSYVERHGSILGIEGYDKGRFRVMYFN